MDLNSRIFVAGHRGLVGSSLVRALKSKGYTNLILKTKEELNLLNPSAVNDFFAKESVDCIFFAAAKVGGILANSKLQGDFLYENTMMAFNTIEAARRFEVKKLLFLGSSCIYPRESKQPIQESSLLQGELEPTNEGYAIAKIAALKLCQHYQTQYSCNFVSAMPTNVYGPGDNFNPFYGHVISALIQKFCKAKQEEQESVVVWGTGEALREFIYVDDLAESLILMMNSYQGLEPVNIGSGVEVSILELANLIKELSGFKGQIIFDNEKPDGMPRKLLDSGKIRSLGWQPKVMLKEGLAKTIDYYVKISGF